MTGTPRSGGRLRAIGAVVLALTFLTGALAGAAFQQVVTAREPASIGNADRGRDRDCGRPPSIYDDLGLTADQQKRLDTVLEGSRSRMDGFWKEVGPRMDGIVDSARAEIRGILTADQQAEVDHRREERRNHRHEREERCKEQSKETSR